MTETSPALAARPRSAQLLDLTWVDSPQPPRKRIRGAFAASATARAP